MPKVKRHTKASQANSTPVTDGTRVVALFGSVGRLIAWDMTGKELWNVDVGILDSGWFFDPGVEDGSRRNPVMGIADDIRQPDCDETVRAYDVETGKEL